MTDVAELQHRSMTDKELAEQGLMALGYTRIKEGVWKHPYFIHSQQINTATGDSALMSLHDSFRAMGCRECQREIRSALGISE